MKAATLLCLAAVWGVCSGQDRDISTTNPNLDDSFSSILASIQSVFGPSGALGPSPDTDDILDKLEALGPDLDNLGPSVDALLDKLGVNDDDSPSPGPDLDNTLGSFGPSLDSFFGSLSSSEDTDNSQSSDRGRKLLRE